MLKARQFGRTSLLARGLQQARKAGARLLLTDFQSLSEADLTSADALYRALAQALQEEGPFGDHLLRLRVALQKSPELTQSMSELLRSAAISPMENFYRLRSAGYVLGDGRKEARPRCELYAMYLSHYLHSMQP